MKSLGLTISRLAQRKSRIRGVGRDALPSPQPQSTSKLDRLPAPSITRDVFQARLICPSQAIRGIRQTTYKNHSISTTQSRDGLWVAAFGRINGEMMEVEAIKHAVLETSPHEAETIAIADAQFQIDEQDVVAL